MKHVIFYFTGTGNSLQIARDLSLLIQNAECRPISKEIKDKREYPIEKCGLVFPVYFGALPPLVVDFLNTLIIKDINYFYAIATCNDFSGGALHIIKKILKNNGKILNAGFSIKMPGNYLPMYAPLSKEKQQERFDNAKVNINKIANIIKNHITVKVSGMGKMLTFLQKGNNKKLHLRDERFWVVEGKCNSCGICEKICPVQNIKLKEGTPTWHHACQQCMACIQWCPQEAIQVGEKTKNRARYQNPFVHLEDLLN